MRRELGRVLVVGYGNPARGDDGLGPAFAEEIAHCGLAGLCVKVEYQLTPEDAVGLGEHEVVVFADATTGGPEPFHLARAPDEAGGAFGSHQIEPSAVLALARILFGARTEGYVLGIRGYDFDGFRTGLSARGRENLEQALAYLVPMLRCGLLRREGISIGGSEMDPALPRGEGEVCLRNDV
jgi:hydrogenase maturation protease